MPKKLKGKNTTKAGINPKKTAPASTETSSAPPIGAGGSYAARQTAPGVMYGILHPDPAAVPDAQFPDAPDGWTTAQAEALATQTALALGGDHWEVVRVLQGCFKDEVTPRLRLLHDALEARFADKGGMKYLYGILPGGPIAQGCALAGLKPPAGARDLSFGSVA